MNVAFINPFLESILNVLSTMAQLEATPGRPMLKNDDVARGDVTGVIGMTSALAKGSLAITFSEVMILHISKRMLGEESKAIDATVTDLVGEITNMVTGGAKRILSDQGYDFDLAIPAIIEGKDHKIMHKFHGPKVIVPFTTEAGEFFVEVCFEQLMSMEPPSVVQDPTFT
ncbi:MAG: chemotaxis protein CheX [Pseudomonadota bacterium]